MLMDLIVEVIGAAPVGWEFVPYLIAALLLVVLFSFLAIFLHSFFRRFWR